MKVPISTTQSTSQRRGSVMATSFIAAARQTSWAARLNHSRAREATPLWRSCPSRASAIRARLTRISQTEDEAMADLGGIFSRRGEATSKSAHHFPVEKSEADWRAQLTPEQDYILREHGTEHAGSCALNTEKRRGTFHCAGCDQALFVNDTKFESGTGWPSFFDPLPGATETTEDNSLFHAPYRGPLQPLRRPSRPCLRRRPAAVRACAIASTAWRRISCRRAETPLRSATGYCIPFPRRGRPCAGHPCRDIASLCDLQQLMGVDGRDEHGHDTDIGSKAPNRRLRSARAR